MAEGQACAPGAVHRRQVVPTRGALCPKRSRWRRTGRGLGTLPAVCCVHACAHACGGLTPHAQEPHRCRLLSAACSLAPPRELAPHPPGVKPGPCCPLRLLLGCPVPFRSWPGPSSGRSRHPPLPQARQLVLPPQHGRLGQAASVQLPPEHPRFSHRPQGSGEQE